MTDLVIAAGGDGTVRFALAALAQVKSDIPLAIIPIGTANVLARNLGVLDDAVLATSLDGAMDTIRNGKRLRIDLGMMNGEYFAVTAGAGPMSDAFVTPRSAEKNTLKLFAYARSLIQAILLPRLLFRVSIEGRSFTVSASAIFASNVEDLAIGKPANVNELTDGGLSLNIVKPKNFKDHVDDSFGFAKRKDHEHPLVYVRKVKEALIEVLPVRSRLAGFKWLAQLFKREGADQNSEPDAAVIAMIDGEGFGTPPMRVQIVPGAVTVLAPSDTEPEHNAAATSAAPATAFPINQTVDVTPPY